MVFIWLDYAARLLIAIQILKKIAGTPGSDTDSYKDLSICIVLFIGIKDNHKEIQKLTNWRVERIKLKGWWNYSEN